MYAPDVVVEAEVQEDRHRKAHHRKWHAGHARYCARMGTENITDDMPEIFGMPACLSAIDRDTRRGVGQSTIHGRPIVPSFTRTRSDFSSTTFGSITSIGRRTG